MTERQAPYKTSDTAVSTKLPDDYLARVDSIRNLDWRGLARVTIDGIEQLSGQHSTMFIYQENAKRKRLGLSTIREFVRYESDERLRDWMDEFDCLEPGYLQIRDAIAEARLRDIDVLIVLQERANESDKYGGMLCPHSAWSAQIAEMRKGKRDKVSPIIRALSSASQNMATAVKHSENGDGRYKALAKELDKLAMEVDKALEKAEEL